MRVAISLLAVLAVLLVATTGCSGPEKKLGRGLNNATELIRLGEWRRSMEQSYLWGGPQTAYTTGFVRGFNKTMARTAVGLYEVLTFPIPTYEPVFKHYLSQDGRFPDSYTPSILADTTFNTDAKIGFSQGDVAPFVPGSRFSVYDE